MVELVIVVAIVAILTAIALPNFRNSMRSGRITTQTNDLLTALNLARNEAITRSRGISICPANTIAGLPSACGSATDWTKGFIVFVDDLTGSTAPTSVTSTNILRSWVTASNMSIVSNATTTPFFRFDARGNMIAPTTPIPTVVTVKPSDVCSGNQKRAIVLTALGRATSSQQACP